jgi:hypothetical protein
MTTILVLLAAVVLPTAYLLAVGPLPPEESEDPWDAGPVSTPARFQAPGSPKTAPKGRHGDRRYHNVDCPVHRRRTDGIDPEI